MIDQQITYEVSGSMVPRSQNPYFPIHVIYEYDYKYEYKYEYENEKEYE